MAGERWDMANSKPLSDVVQNIGKQFVLVDGRPELTEESLRASWNELRAVAQEQREKTATDLVALALKFQRLGSAAAETAVIQLALLAGELLQDFAAITNMLESQGADLSGAMKFLGGQTKKRPVTQGKLSDARSILSLLRAAKK
jgi:hypothetical protein